jgi:hypothetical protein
LKALAQRAAQQLIQTSGDPEKISNTALTMKPELKTGESVRKIG